MRREWIRATAATVTMRGLIIADASCSTDSDIQTTANDIMGVSAEKICALDSGSHEDHGMIGL